MTCCSLNKLYLQLMPYVAKPHLLKFSHLAIKPHARLTTTVVKWPLLHTTCVTQTPVQLASYVAMPLQWLSQSVNFCTGYNQDCGGLTVDNVCKVWTKKLEDAGTPDPKVSVDLIVAHAMGKKMLHEVSNDAQVDENTARHIKDMCEWRMDRCPVQYIIKEWDFHDLTLKMRPPVFIPRPETEELADLVCKSVRSRGLDNHHNVRFLEIGCGSGAISLYLLHQLSKVEGIAIDKGIQACELTQENAELCHVSDRINIQNLDFTSDDAFQTLKEYGRFDIIVSNPPYIPTEEIPQLEPEVVRFEDRIALNGGQDGLAIIRLIMQRAPDLLTPKGQLWLETGLGQTSVIADTIAQVSDSRLTYTATKKDFSGRDRFCMLTLK